MSRRTEIQSVLAKLPQGVNYLRSTSRRSAEKPGLRTNVISLHCGLLEIYIRQGYTGRGYPQMLRLGIRGDSTRNGLLRLRTGNGIAKVLFDGRRCDGHDGEQGTA